MIVDRLLPLVHAVAFLAAPVAATKDAAEVVELYKAKCQVCHMADGKSPLAPMDLTDGKWIHGSNPAQVAKVISEGAPGTAMLAFKDLLTAKQISDLAAYVRAFDKSLKTKARPKSRD